MAYKQKECTPVTAKVQKTTKGGMVQQPLLNMGAPVKMKSPAKQGEGPGDKDKKSKEKAKYEPAKVGEVPGVDEVKDRFKGKYKVVAKSGKTNEYSLYDKQGGSVSYKAGAKVEDKKKDITNVIKASANKKSK